MQKYSRHDIKITNVYSDNKGTLNSIVQNNIAPISVGKHDVMHTNRYETYWTSTRHVGRDINL